MMLALRIVQLRLLLRQSLIYSFYVLHHAWSKDCNDARAGYRCHSCVCCWCRGLFSLIVETSTRNDSCDFECFVVLLLGFCCADDADDACCR